MRWMEGEKRRGQEKETLTAGEAARETASTSKVKQRSERNTRESRRGLAKEPKVSRSLGVAADR